MDAARKGFEMTDTDGTGHSTEVPAGAVRLFEYLKGKGVEHIVLDHEPTYTAIDEAEELGVVADDVLKTVVVETSSGHVLAVVPASRKLEMNLVRVAVGDKEARLATEAQLEAAFPDFDLGALPPVGSLLAYAPVYVDPKVMEHDIVVFAAGSRTRSVRMNRQELLEGQDVTIAAMTLDPLPAEDPI